MQHQHPPNCVANLPTGRKVNFNVAETVIIPLRSGECRETRIDDLLLWCRQNCAERFSPIKCRTNDALTFAFESVDDAVLFRLSA
jgi:hypothetical protein